MLIETDVGRDLIEMSYENFDLTPKTNRLAIRKVGIGVNRHIKSNGRLAFVHQMNNVIPLPDQSEPSVQNLVKGRRSQKLT